MTKLASLLAIAAISVFGTACTVDTRSLDKKLDDVNKTLGELKVEVAAIKQAGGRPAGGAPARPQRPAPDPAKTYAIPVDGDPFIGPADAKVTIVKAYEYACPFCERVRPTLDEVVKAYGDDVRVVYKQSIVHPQVATLPSQAVCAAHRQGRFFDMDAAVWEKAFKARNFDESNLLAIAKELGLDMTRFEADMRGDCTAFVKQDMAPLERISALGTPTFFINGRYLIGAKTVAELKAVIDDELAKANKRIAEGTAQADYYKTWIVEKGLTALDAPAAAPAKPRA